MNFQEQLDVANNSAVDITVIIFKPTEATYVSLKVKQCNTDFKIIEVNTLYMLSKTRFL